MNTPRTRAEFERNFDLLHRQIKEDKFRIAQGLTASLDGMARVRYLPNGRVDFLSVDESARSLANTTAHFSSESMLKRITADQALAYASTVEQDKEPSVSDPE